MKSIITDRKEAGEAGLLNSGTYFIRTADNMEMYLPLLFDCTIDLEHLIMYTPNENATFPTLSEILGRGLVQEKKIYQFYDVCPSGFEDRFSRIAFTEGRIRSIIADFKEHGFNVSRKALIHNYDAWRNDLKSGFRDDDGGYHLFSPCGCNPLQFRASSLNDYLGWQDTYVA